MQRRLYDMAWRELRPVQSRTIAAFNQSPQDILIIAETAGGKTEAAFLPLLSAISQEPLGSVRALYVGPLRALINDQFERVERLCERMEMPVHRWHSDVSASRKSDLMKNPGGVLLITPESIESLLINRTALLHGVFRGLRCVVIDELHAFLGSERGLHLASLLCRLERFVESPPRRIALSATIGDVGAAVRWMDPDSPDSVIVVEDDPGGVELQMRIHSYSPGSSRDESEAEHDRLTRRAEDLVEDCRGSSNLVFANAKGDIELQADLCNETCRREGLPETFLVHHGSLSAEIREAAESDMKSTRALTTICSSTLEMGIDIGSVRLVGQIGAPPSVASFRQRLGRSGRREGEPRRTRLYIDLPEAEPGDILGRMPIELLRAVAIVNLTLENWLEPLEPARCDLSTLTHQVLAFIAETGGAPADRIYATLCVRGPFRATDQRLFGALLRCLASSDLIEQAPTGELILGLLGEKLRASRDFYAAFMGADEFALVHDGRPLGALPTAALPSPGDHLIFAAKRWVVLDLDPRRREILVGPATGKKKPIFTGVAGDVHARVAEEMRRILAGVSDLRFVDGAGVDAIRRAREDAARENLATRRFLTLGERTTAWLVWTGSAAQRTIMAALRIAGIDSRIRGVAIMCEASVSDLEDAAQDLLSQKVNALALAHAEPSKVRRKYDGFLSEELLDLSLAVDAMDLEATRAVAAESLGHARM